MYSKGAGTPPVYDAVNALHPLPISVLAENQNYIAETTFIGEYMRLHYRPVDIHRGIYCTSY